MPAPAQQPEPEPVEAEMSNHAQKAHSLHQDVAFLVGEVAFFSNKKHAPHTKY